MTIKSGEIVNRIVDDPRSFMEPILQLCGASCVALARSGHGTIVVQSGTSLRRRMLSSGFKPLVEQTGRDLSKP
jgi:hypothetical protein